MIQSDSYISKAELIAHFLAEKKVPALFQLSGGMIAFLTDAVSQLGLTPIVNTRHEQAAGFAAESATRVTGRSAVAMATSGPGATNLITAIASSFFDSVPTVFITGQVNQTELKKNLEQRQNGFQELDIVNLAKPITKFAIGVTSKTDLQKLLSECWEIAHDGRPGPVLIDIPIDVQQEMIPFPGKMLWNPIKSGKVSNQYKQAENLMNLVENSKRPIFLLGGGIRTAQIADLVRKVIVRWNVPAVYSLMAVDVLDNTSVNRVGMIGSYGNRWANNAIARADLIIALGSRLDVRQTGTDVEAFVQGKQIFRVDVDPFEIKGRIKADYSVQGELDEFVEAMLLLKPNIDCSEWLTSIQAEAEKYPQEEEQIEHLEFNPNQIMKWISDIADDSNGFLVDVGQHQMWAAQSLSLNNTQRFLTSGGMGAMGFALPAAIGASIAQKGRWYAIVGDGCAQLSIAELQTIKHYNLPITVIIINNQQHGMVAQFQETNMDGRFTATRDGYSAPDFCSIGEAYGIKSVSLKNMDELNGAKHLLQNWNSGPLMIEVKVSNSARALPKLGSTSSNTDL